MVDFRLEEVKTTVIEEASPQESIPSSNSSWVENL